MARALGYGGMVNTNGVRSFAGKTLATAGIDDRLILVGDDASAPIATGVSILRNDELIRSITRKYNLWLIFAGTYTLLKQLLG